VFLTADLASTTQTWSDYTVVIVWGRAPDGRLFVLDLVRGKYEAPKVVPVLHKIFNEWGAKVLYLEASGPLTKLNREAEKAGLPIREYKIHANKGQNDKVQRAQPCAVAVVAGRGLLPKIKPVSGSWFPSRFVGELFAAACGVPDEVEHDDQVDALALGVLAAPKPTAAAAQRSRTFHVHGGEHSIRTDY